MSRVPGTFKSDPGNVQRDLSPSGVLAERLLVGAGALHAERWLLGNCTIMCSREPAGWHVSISHPSRYPTWDEIKVAIYSIDTIALPEGRAFAQILGPVADGEWANVDHNCFHFYEIENPLQ